MDDQKNSSQVAPLQAEYPRAHTSKRSLSKELKSLQLRLSMAHVPVTSVFKRQKRTGVQGQPWLHKLETWAT